MPPFKSEAQRRKIQQLEREGKVKAGTSAQWARETKGKLPERVGKPRKASRPAAPSPGPSSTRAKFGLKS